MHPISFDSTRPFDLVLLGRAAVDLNPVDYFAPLKKNTTFKRYLGGSPANIAVGLARLNKKVGFFARVSDDQLGDFVYDCFEEEGVDTSRIRRSTHGEKLGLTFTEMLSPSESHILMYRNQIADLSLETGDIDQAYIASAKALLISGTSLAQSPSREAALKAAALAVKTGTPIIFDIDYREYNWRNKDEIALYYSAVARQSTVILGSREEYDLAEGLLGLPGTDEASAAYWHGQGAKIVVIKHGKQGSTAYTSDGNSYAVKPFPVQAFKTFGGGDGYASAFIYGLLEGWEIIDCLEFGSASAAMLVGSHACSADMPTRESIQAFIAQSKAQYGEMVARS